jgi:undecaprenyl diphosphate synthase
MSIPRCVVFTPDGNRRWAKEKGLPAMAGHRRGFVNGEKIVEAAFRRGVQHVVFWGASLANLEERPKNERTNLFSLLKKELLKHKENTERIHFRLRGLWKEFTADAELKSLAAEVEEKTSLYKAQQLTVLFGYDGEPEGDAALQSLFASGEPRKWKNLCNRAWTGHLPNVDLYIRTGSGYQYLSGSFMPFKLCNTLLQFPAKYWPDYTVRDLEEAFDTYSAFAHERRCGK